MKKQTIFLIPVTLMFSLACQFLIPSNRDGTIVSACTDVVQAFRGVQPGMVPQSLRETGIKQGGEFDVNDYFKAFTHLSMEQGYTLDYVYQVDFLGAFPILYARPADQPAYASANDLHAGTELSDYLAHISVDGSEQGYYEFVALSIMARQFYLDWHANYNDTVIVCNDNDVDAIVEDINDGEFGIPFDMSQQMKIRGMKDIEPLVKMNDDTALVELIMFTKWGGFYRLTYTINRSFPHAITDVQQENLVTYDCGIMF